MTISLRISKWLGAGLAIFAGSFAQSEVIEKSGYRLDTTKLCDGLPQISVSTQDGMCVGLLAGKQDGLKMPRYAVQSKEGVIYVSEMGGWAFGKGTVFAVYQAQDADRKTKTVVVNLFPNKKLTMPNGLLMDPEGRLYVGTPTGVMRFHPRDPATGKFNIDTEMEVVANDFVQSIFRKDEFAAASRYNTMDNKLKNKHPLVQMAANKEFTEIYVNVGAPSDDCGSGIKTTNDQNLCIQSDSPLANAAVWKVTLSNNSQRKTVSARSFARGLRNSMALAVHPISGVVIQGENGLDLPLEDKPYEELNILEEGRHYGWPYCHSAGEVAPLFQQSVTAEMCAKKYALPKVFMPAHTAPLGMLYYQGDLLPALKNRLLVGWHGYQKFGHRVVSYPVDARGVPTSNEYSEVVFGWKALEGVRPRGAPTGLTLLNDGSVLIMDDKNGALLRLSKGQRIEDIKDANSTQAISEKTLSAFLPLVPFVTKNCAMCHSQFQKANAVEMLQEMRGTMLNTNSPFESSFWLKLQSRQMPPEMIRSALGFQDDEFEKILPQVEEFLKTLGGKP